MYLSKVLTASIIIVCLVSCSSQPAISLPDTVPFNIQWSGNQKKVVDIPLRQTFQRILIEGDGTNAKAVVILFAGGSGWLKLNRSGDIKRENNFLIRSRHRFFHHNLITVVFEATKDRQANDGMNHGWRSSTEHARDVAHVVGFLKGRYPLPVWLVGTSRGTVSVANAGTRIKSGLSGLVFTAAITEENARGGNVLDFPIRRIRIPTIVAHHTQDACEKTPPRGARRIYQQLVPQIPRLILLYKGGSRDRSTSCRSMSRHGFLGIEEKVITEISRWIIDQSKI